MEQGIVFEKVSNIDKTLARMIRETMRSTKAKIRNERDDITTNTAVLKRKQHSIINNC